MSTFKKDFKVGDYVFYPYQGLGEIKSLEHIKFKGKDELYYIAHINSNDMIIKFPGFSISNLGIRKLSSLQKAKQVFEDLVGDKALKDEWHSKQITTDLLNKSSLEDVSNIIKSLYYKIKNNVPIIDKIYEQACSILIDELSVVLKKSKEEINRKLEESLSVDSEDYLPDDPEDDSDSDNED